MGAIVRTKRWGLSEWVGMTDIFGVGMGIGWDIPLHFVLGLDIYGLRLGRETYLIRQRQPEEEYEERMKNIHDQNYISRPLILFSFSAPNLHPQFISSLCNASSV